MAAAQDSGGEQAAGRFYDDARVTFTTLIDERHLVTALFGAVNVPTGVWIDEQGRIVRPPETAWSRRWTFGDLAVGDERYVQALRDWVAKGAKSPYVLSGEVLRARLAGSNPDRPLADAHFRLAVHLYGAGQREAAARHWRSAQELDPLNWNYHRQEWAFDPGTAGAKWRAKYESLGGRPYYDPPALDLPARDR